MTGALPAEHSFVGVDAGQRGADGGEEGGGRRWVDFPVCMSGRASRAR